MYKKKKRIIQIVLGIIIICCAAFLINYYVASSKSEKAMVELKADSIEVDPDIPIDFEAVWEINEDAIAWISIEDTDVDYPVMQHPTTDNYYMDHDVNKVQNWIPGALYINLCDSPDFKDNVTIIYGHNMGNKTMFGTLMNFYEEDFFTANGEKGREIVIYTPEHIYTYEVFAAVTYNNKLISALYDLDSEAGFQQYLDSLYENGSIRDHYTDKEVTTDDKVLTLSTCTIDHDHTYRFLVVGVLINEE